MTLWRFLSHRLGHYLSPASPGPPQAGLPLAKAVEDYQQALDQTTPEAQTFLAVLLARDAVEAARQQTNLREAVEVLHQCIRLDERLPCLARPHLKTFPAWRKLLQPSQTVWWWFLDQAAQAEQAQQLEQAQKNDLLWTLLTGTLVLLTVTLGVEMIKRLWTGASDLAAIFGTLLILLLTGSPFAKRGQDLAQWVFKRIPRLAPRYRAEAMAAMAFLAFGLVLLGWWFGLPRLALSYSNQGLADLLGGNVTAAQRHFERAVALNPDQVVAYHNLADAYDQVGQPEQALIWYQQAIVHDYNFGPAYVGLSRLYNDQGQFSQAARIALAGLRPENETPDADIALFTRYALLAQLGRAYVEQEQYELAQNALEAALALEDKLKPLEATYGQLRQALPHYYLAHLYEQQDNVEAAQEQWREALRYLKAEQWDDQPWLVVIQQKLKQPPEQD